jgi:S-layer protein
MAISTNGTVLARLAGGLYNTQMSNATYSEVKTLDPSALANTLYARDFASATDLSVATTLVTNLGLTSVTGLANWVAAQLTAAGTGNKGAKIVDLLNGFAQMTADTTYGAAATAFNALVDAALVLSQTTGNAGGSFAAAGIAPAATFTLTTGIDSPTIGANTTVNAILGTGATWNTFDRVVGTGTTAFNIVDNTAGAFAAPVGSTVSGIGAVTLSRAAASGATAIDVTVTNSTFGSGVTSFSLVESGAATVAGPVAVTLNSATSVSVVDSQSTKFTTVAVTDGSTAATTLNTVSITGSSGNGTLTGNAITTLNLNAAATGGTVTVTSTAGARALTINTAGSTSSGSVTDAQATSVVLNQTSAAGLGTLTAAKATSVTVNTTGTSTTAGAETITAATATTITLGGTRANTVTLTGNSALTTLVATGSGGVTFGDVSGITTLTSVDTSGSTAVASSATATNKTVANSVTLGVNTSFIGGAGNDQVTVGATTKAINLGAGVNKVTLIDGTTAVGTGGSITGSGADTLAFATAANAASVSGSSSASAAFKAAVTGFSTLELGQIGGATSIDVNRLAATGVITQVNETGNAAANTLTISNLASGATIQVTGANTGAGTTTAGTTGSGTSDTLNIALKDGSGAAVAFGTFTTPNVENINFVMSDTQTTPVGYLNTATLTDAAAYSIKISGNSGLSLTSGTAATNLQSFDASGVTKGGVAFTADALQYASIVLGSTSGGDSLDFSAALATVSITETAGANTIKGSKTVASTLTGGTGADTIFGGTGADTVNGGAGADVIYANNAGNKQVQVVTLATNALATETVTVTIAGTATTVTAATGLLTPTQIAAAFVTSINGNAELAKLGVASSSSGVLTFTSTVDGAIGITAATTSSTLTATAGTIGTTAGTSAGSSTTTGADVITGGAGSDTFVFGISSAAPSATANQSITDFNVGGTSDYLFYAPTTVALPTAITTAVAGTAAISSNGIATFVTNDQVSLAAQLTAVASAIQANTTAAGKSVAFQYGSDAYVFISDATNGVTAGDVLVKLTGVSLANSTTDQLVASGHTLTLA